MTTVRLMSFRLMALVAVTVALCATFLATPGSAAAAPAARVTTVRLTAPETTLLNRINAARAAGGMRAVTLDSSLTTLARDRSADMARRGYFDHRNPDGKTFLDLMRTRHIPFYMAGEIIAQNNYPAAQTVDQAYQGYMGSSEHHAILMMGNWRTVGVGQAVDRNGMYYYTVIFAQATR